MHHIIITWTGAEMALGEEMKGRRIWLVFLCAHHWSVISGYCTR
jgi:hypothetical protein